MSKRMSNVCWDVDCDISKSTMDRRIKNCTRHFGWQHAVELILERKVSFTALRIAELGCGTGTTALTFGLLGASVTLIDFNRRVLEKARDLYSLYGCDAELIQADCMKHHIAHLAERFDFIISSGLAEHFIGDDRTKCIRYHRVLLKKGGVAYIGVPNKLSPFYQWVRSFRKVTGTWNLEIEIPFTPKELKEAAIRSGFKESYVIGNALLRNDLIDYSRGFGSAVKQLLSAQVQERLQIHKETKKIQSYSTEDMRHYCKDMVAAVDLGYFKRPNFSLVNTFSAGIILFAFN